MIICLIITFCIVYIWDYVEFPRELISQILHMPVELKKPWGCSLCMTTWITLIALLFINWKLSWMCILFGFSTKYILYTIQTIDLILSTIFVLIEKLFEKIKKHIL